MHGIVPRTVKLTALVAIKFACPPRALLSMNMPTQRGVSAVVRVAAAGFVEGVVTGAATGFAGSMGAGMAAGRAAASTIAPHASAVSVAADFQRVAKRFAQLNSECC